MQTDPVKTVYVDSSAFYALMDRSDVHHEPAKAIWPFLLEAPCRLLTCSYVVSETLQLLQSRLGFEAARIWQGSILQVVETQWADRSTHETARELWMSLGRQGCSIVDCVSYVIMNRLRVKKAFCFKAHFADQGYSLLPGSMDGVSTGRTNMEID